MHMLITGSAGSGTTTLGQALSRKLSARHLDTDDFYWAPSEPPIQVPRAADQRLSMLMVELDRQPHVVLSGSLVAWGAEVEDRFDLIVFLYLPARIRLQRLARRDLARLGHVNPAFMAWAAQYDQGTLGGRCLAGHKAWLAQRRCPVLQLVQDLTTEQRVAIVLEALARRGFARRAGPDGAAPRHPIGRIDAGTGGTIDP